jgi:hypothetical protein
MINKMKDDLEEIPMAHLWNVVAIMGIVVAAVAVVSRLF